MPRLRRQTSITAGTVMHGSKMPLTVWFSASYLIATYPDGLPAQQLEVLLAIGYKNACLLKQKLRQRMESVALEGLVEVAHTEIRFRGADNFLDPAKSGKIIVAAAMSCLEIGSVRIFVYAEPRSIVLSPQRAEGSKRSPNRMANCPIATVHSIGLCQ